MGAFYFYAQMKSQARTTEETLQAALHLSKRRHILATLTPTRSFEIQSNDIPIMRYNRAHLYIINAAKNIIKTDTLGTVVGVIGREGHAPGEFALLMDASIDDSTIACVDVRRLILSEFNIQGKLLYEFNYNQPIDRGTRISGRKYLLKLKHNDGTVEHPKEIFTLLDTKTGTTTNVTVPRLNASRSKQDWELSMELDGFFSVGGGYVIRTSYMTGQFVVFDTAGTFRYQSTTIDTSPLPEVITKGSGKSAIMFYGARTRAINFASAITSKHIYILSNAADASIVDELPGVCADGIIDVYSVQNGKYAGSLKIPRYKKDDKKSYVATTFALGEHGLYVVHGAYICYYPLNLGSVLS